MGKNICTPVARALKSRFATRILTHLWWETVSSARSRCSAAAISWSPVTSRWDRPARHWLCSSHKGPCNCCCVRVASHRCPYNTHCSFPTWFHRTNWTWRNWREVYERRAASRRSVAHRRSSWLVWVMGSGDAPTAAAGEISVRRAVQCIVKTCQPIAASDCHTMGLFKNVDFFRSLEMKTF